LRILQELDEGIFFAGLAVVEGSLAVLEIDHRGVALHVILLAQRRRQRAVDAGERARAVLKELLGGLLNLGLRRLAVPAPRRVEKRQHVLRLGNMICKRRQVEMVHAGRFLRPPGLRWGRGRAGGFLAARGTPKVGGGGEHAD